MSLYEQTFALKGTFESAYGEPLDRLADKFQAQTSRRGNCFINHVLLTRAHWTRNPSAVLYQPVRPHIAPYSFGLHCKTRSPRGLFRIVLFQAPLERALLERGDDNNPLEASPRGTSILCNKTNTDKIFRGNIPDILVVGLNMLNGLIDILYK